METYRTDFARSDSCGTFWRQDANLTPFVCVRSNIVAVGWRATFEVLKESENQWAERLLLASLADRARPEAVEALGVLLTRHNAEASRLAIREWRAFPESWRREVVRHPAGMQAQLREALLGDDRAAFESACDICLAGEDFDAIPLLLEIAEDPRRGGYRHASQTVLQLADQLHEKCHAPRDYVDRRDPQIIRQHVASCLELAAAKFEKHRQTQLVEAFLLTTTRENATLRSALQSSREPLHEPLKKLLTTSPRFGVFRLLLSFLDAHASPVSMIEAAVDRCDSDYFEALCGHLSDASSHARANLKRLSKLAWLGGVEGLLMALSDDGQCGLVRLLTATSIPKPRLTDALKALISEGRPAARALATASLADIPGPAADALILKLVDDPDPETQASALRQLRPRQLPGALATLLSRSESPYPAIDAAVRDSLAEFTFARYLAAFDTMSPAVRESTGAIVLKVDRETPGQLAIEIAASGRVRKLRAIEMATTLQLVEVVEESLIDAMRDEDHAVRSAAAAALADSPSPMAKAALKQALMDADLTVRAAAEKALQQRANLNVPRPRAPSDTIGWQAFLDASRVEESP